MSTDERRTMGRTGRQFVSAHYSLEAILDRWEELYARLLGLPVGCLAREAV